MSRLKRLVAALESDLRRTGTWDRLCQLCDERGLEPETTHWEGEEVDGSDGEEE